MPQTITRIYLGDCFNGNEMFPSFSELSYSSLLLIQKQAQISAYHMRLMTLRILLFQNRYIFHGLPSWH